MDKINMKTYLILALICLFVACQKITDTYDYNRPPTEFSDKWILAQWEKQRESWQYQKKWSPVWVENKLFAQSISEIEKRKLDSFAFDMFFTEAENTIAMYRHWTRIIILKYKTHYYLWTNIDVVDKFFWNNTDNVMGANGPFLFDFHDFYFEYRIGYLEGSNHSEEYDTNARIGRQEYIQAKNDSGYVFDVSHFEQFKQIDTSLYENKNFHGKENIVKIDTLLRFLHNKNDGEPFPYFVKMPTNPYFLDTLAYELLPSFMQKKIADTVRIKVRGVDFHKGILYYFDGIDTVRNELIDIRHKVFYTGFRQKTDTLAILGDYLSYEKPTFLYYKQLGTEGTVWYNYFVAYHITYNENGIPRIAKVSAICPQRLQRFRCYQFGCDDYSNMFNQIVRSIKQKE